MDDAAATAAVASVRPDTFLSHWRIIREAKDGQQNEGAAVARAKKAAKRDGVDLDAVAMLERLAKLDREERENLIRKLFVYSDWLSMPLAAAAEGIMVPEPKASTTEEFAIWQAKQDGKAAGKKGHPRDTNPHMAGSVLYPAWDKAWSASFAQNQKKLAGDLAKNAEAGGRSRRRANGETRAAH